jgi:hypothetical protein
MGYAVVFLTEQALAELDITEQLDPGEVLPREERLAAARHTAEGA